jgi:hypothetical protein
MDSNAAKDVMAQPPPASTLPVSTTALRWLGRVESRITREGPGYVEGTVSLDLNLALLNPSAATPAAAQPQRARSESD